MGGLAGRGEVIRYCGFFSEKLGVSSAEGG